MCVCVCGGEGKAVPYVAVGKTIAPSMIWLELGSGFWVRVWYRLKVIKVPIYWTLVYVHAPRTKNTVLLLW